MFKGYFGAAMVKRIGPIDIGLSGLDRNSGPIDKSHRLLLLVIRIAYKRWFIVLLSLHERHCYYDNNRCRPRRFRAMSKTIAYLRVSTAEQDLKKNRFAILELANDK